MNENCYIIRLEKQNEERAVENLVRESFWNIYRPGAYEHFLLHIMRKHKDFVKELNLVMELDGEVIGQTAFVKSHILTDDGRKIPTLTLGPICISPKYTRRGYGKILLDFAFDKAHELGYGAVMLEGNIDFYEKCGCTEASRYNIRYHGIPKDEDTPYFLCRVLRSGYFDNITGEYAVPDVYFVSDEDVEKYDKSFEPKPKLKLEGQLF